MLIKNLIMIYMNCTAGGGGLELYDGSDLDLSIDERVGA